jgi:hypothetical protein
MKQDPSRENTRNRMQPGAISIDGFLGHDDRPLDQIIDTDMAILREANITAKAAADMLNAFHKAADQGMEGDVPLKNGRIKVRVTEVMGRIPCPFACGAHEHKAVITVTYNNNQQLSFTPLGIHLLREHGFLQGKEASFRLPPERLIELYKIWISSD